MRRSKLVKVAKRKKNALLKANGRTPSQIARIKRRKNRSR
tara:strand:- start:1158 stop:1277 length:120 start_codon:yes stop_codon:yes gene_type:complete